MSNQTSPQVWLQNNWPNARAVDKNWTMKRYDYPNYVCEYIFENWIKVSEKNGGTFCEPNYYKQLPSNHKYKESQNQEKVKEDKEDKESNFFQNFKDNNPNIYNQMDVNNKAALNVGAKHDSQAMFDYMFKDPKTGRQLSYAESRMFYG